MRTVFLTCAVIMVAVSLDAQQPTPAPRPVRPDSTQARALEAAAMSPTVRTSERLSHERIAFLLATNGSSFLRRDATYGDCADGSSNACR